MMNTKELIYLAAFVVAGYALLQVIKARAAPAAAAQAARDKRITTQDDAAEYRQELFRSVPDDFWV